MPVLVERTTEQRWLAFAGALACAVAVALGAYASHGAEGQAQSRIALAALMLFGHGLAVMALAPRGTGAMIRWSLRILALGVLLFSGSLILAAGFAMAAPLAPAGGLLLILGWFMLAVAAVRGRI